MSVPLPPIPTRESLARERVRRQSALWRARPVVFGLLVIGLSLFVHSHHPSTRAMLVEVLAVCGVLVGGMNLQFSRRRSPLFDGVMFTVLICGSVTLAWIQPDGPGFVGGFLAAAVAAVRTPRRLFASVAVVTLAALAVASTVGAHRSLMSVGVSEIGAFGFYRLGQYAHRLRLRTEQYETLLVELEETRAAQLRAATLVERQRLAREMHDVLAHSLSGLVLHLEGARLLAVRDAVTPQLADTLERAHHLAQAGLGEARQAIGMLRDEDLPGPERLPGLARDFEADTGVACRLDVTGDAVELEPQTRLTVYRVAQEALTNIRKHATPLRVEMCLSYEAGGVALTVEDFAAGGAAAPVADDHGYGVTGMRERAELLGGTLDVSPTSTGFRVALRVPA